MRHRSSQTKFGMVALAGIAILGWVREPERHRSSDLLGEGSTLPRKTFAPPPDNQDVAAPRSSDAGAPADGGESAVHLPVSVESGRLRVLRPKVQTGHASDRRRAVTRASEPAASNGGRHEDPETHDEGLATRSREPEPANARVEQPPAGTGEGHQQPQTQADGNGRRQTQSVRTTERSNVRSAAIIAGVAAAGAAIGGVTGGGKGAAIGAITGGAGGYVYDRMTRRKTTSVPGTGGSDIDRPSQDAEGFRAAGNRGPSLARRFGTPAFF